MGLTLLRDKVALVTGGAHGSGAAIANALASSGARVALTYHHSESEARLLTTQIRQQGGEAIALRTDARSPETCAHAVTRTLELWGQLDILVNQAAVTISKPFNEIELREFEQTMAINVRAALLTSQLAARRMPQGGRIIHISSPRHTGHSDALGAMSRAALTALTQAMAHDLGPQGITVNHLLPAEPIPHPASVAIPAPSSLSALVLWLASPAASHVSGNQFNLNGGYDDA